MIKIEDIKAKQDELNKMIEKFAKQEEIKKDTYELEYPEKGRGICSLHWDGTLTEGLYYNKSRECIFEQGNIFETKGQAILESKRRNLLTRFRQFRDRCNGDWVPDFEDGNTKKYHIYYDACEKHFDIDYFTEIREFTLFGYFKNKEDAQRAIELFGDEIKELFVEEV